MCLCAAKNYLLTSLMPDTTSERFNGLHNLQISTVTLAICGLLDEVRKVFPDATAVDIRGHIRQKLSNAVKLLRVQKLKQPNMDSQINE